MLGGADNPNGELLSYITGADTHYDGSATPENNNVLTKNSQDHQGE